MVDGCGFTPLTLAKWAFDKVDEAVLIKRRAFERAIHPLLSMPIITEETLVVALSNVKASLTVSIYPTEDTPLVVHSEAKAYIPSLSMFIPQGRRGDVNDVKAYPHRECSFHRREMLPLTMSGHPLPGDALNTGAHPGTPLTRSKHPPPTGRRQDPHETPTSNVRTAFFTRLPLLVTPCL